MLTEIILILFFLMWYFLVALAILFLISGIDDLFFDIFYWSRYIYRLWKTRNYEPLTYEKLADKPEQFIAVLIPCWHEAGVISTMLKHNCYSIDYDNYYLFVGVYPNDPNTVAEVEDVAQSIPHVQCVIGDNPGPTSKAANLNHIYLYIKEFEKSINQEFAIYVFHDSEDIIHPLSFKLYNYLIPRKDMIQIPVFPLAVKYREFTHWLYADEFSENHTKDILVREAIQAHVPSAGVGTAFSRKALETLENPNTHTPFSVDSLTEDYRTSLAIRVRNLKQIFVTQSVQDLQWKRHWLIRNRYRQKLIKEYVATRALFPREYKKAVRQKARWIIGIVFQEWNYSHWPKGWTIRYTLMHDRKSFITHFINGFGYFVFTFWFIYSITTYQNPLFPSLQEQFNLHPTVWWMIVAVTLIMIERLIQRVIAVKRVYQRWWPALLAIPRAFYGNILNLHALIRAYRIYYSAPKPDPNAGNQPVWDKTDHEFPGRHLLIPYKRKLGDLLIENKLLTPDQLKAVIIEQKKTKERLGDILKRLNLINDDQLLMLLAQQYQLEILPQSRIHENQKNCLKALSLRKINWLIKHNATPVDVNLKDKQLTLAITDPTNELLITRIIHSIKPYTAYFVLLDKNN